MNPHLKYVLVALLVLVTTPSFALKLPQPQVSYTSESTLEMDHGTIHSRIFYRPDMLRREDNIGGLERVFIMREDLRQAWVLMPQDKTYLELNWHQAKRLNNDLLDHLKSKELVEEVDIQGHKIRKYEIVAIQPDGTKFDGLLWLTEEGIPVKIDAGDRSTGFIIPYKRQLKKLKIVKKLKANLFEIPSDYTPIVQEKQKRLLVREMLDQMRIR